jgi:hypothetical protein
MANDVAVEIGAVEKRGLGRIGHKFVHCRGVRPKIVVLKPVREGSIEHITETK